MQRRKSRPPALAGKSDSDFPSAEQHSCSANRNDTKRGRRKERGAIFRPAKQRNCGANRNDTTRGRRKERRAGISAPALCPAGRKIAGALSCECGRTAFPGAAFGLSPLLCLGSLPLRPTGYLCRAGLSRYREPSGTLSHTLQGALPLDPAGALPPSPQASGARLDRALYLAPRSFPRTLFDLPASSYCSIISLNRFNSFFSFLDTCTCVIPITSAVTDCVFPRKYRRYISLLSSADNSLNA